MPNVYRPDASVIRLMMTSPVPGLWSDDDVDIVLVRGPMVKLAHRWMGGAEVSTHTLDRCHYTGRTEPYEPTSFCADVMCRRELGVLESARIRVHEDFSEPLDSYGSVRLRVEGDVTFRFTPRRQAVSEPGRNEVIANWLQLIRAEYLEVPGLRLTRKEAERLWGLDPLVCESLLTALVDANFLKRTRRDEYVRAEATR